MNLLVTFSLAIGLAWSLAIPETYVDATSNALTKRDAVTYLPGQFTVYTSPNPFITVNNCNFVFEPSVCQIYVYCGGAFKQAIGGQTGNCNSPDYGILIYQEGTGNFYIARDNDPNQVLWQTGVSSDYLESNNFAPYIQTKYNNGVAGYSSPTNPPNAPGCGTYAGDYDF
ncbi:hypothetical protein M409DRAFT_21688 [Zasmidium cellare ATCC 36951]|uniref:Bulb-type lectin domain-containing protein n=1 Tax=Zasmidium cellare ATCC 36951 TaxID=1080233 RepID=A0A6A6CQ40_ZASCE|nr:uncharacterized protein M409DRAFT_21688 [Zasmidium cellare ATCC 36951]KAF2168250.1 hypothetical protein M409DRAFT_21688 [Zasmidium cellare ATCC 36951]